MKTLNMLKQAVLTGVVALFLAGALAPRTEAPASSHASLQADYAIQIAFGGKDGNETHG